MSEILFIVGARPQFIKLAPLTLRLPDNLDFKILHTGQHYDYNMSDQFFEDLHIPTPHFNLGIGSSTHGKQTGEMLTAIEKVLLEESFNLVVVFGDTNSTIAGALAAAKLSIPIIHIEAGLRSFNRTMPEEINRVVTDHTSDYLFAPTQIAMDNLKTEGLENKSIFTGDIMVDSLKDNLNLSSPKKRLFENLDMGVKDFFLLTLHRPYNVDDPEKLSTILDKLSHIDNPILFPAHPRTQQIIQKNDLIPDSHIKIIDPLGYLDFITLEATANKIITDSGGIQKEAYILKTPCLTLRPETEWIETVKSGWNILLDVENPDFLESILSFSPPGEHRNIFGENVADYMVEMINKILIP